MSNKKEKCEENILKCNTEGKEIPAMVSSIRREMLLSEEELAKQLLVTKEDITKITFLQNSEISTELLFRIYFMATLILENPALESFLQYCAKNLKEKCKEEIFKRETIKNNL